VTGVYLELYQKLASRRDAWLSAAERRFATSSAEADDQEKKRRKDEQDERERLLLEHKVEAERLAETEKQRSAAAERLAENEKERAAAERVRATEQTEAATRYRRIATIAALVTAFALISAAVASWYWDKSVKAQQLAAMRFLAINARRAVETNNTLDGIERAGALALESIAVARKLNRPAETDALEAGRRVLIRLPLVALTHGSPLFSL